MPARISRWLNEPFFGRMLKNSAKLFCAGSFSAVIGLLVAVLTARALGSRAYGILAFFMAGELIIGQFTSFNAWQAVIRYGSEVVRDHNEAALQKLVKFTFSLDVASSLAGYIIAALLSESAVALLGLDPSAAGTLRIYFLLILVRFSGMPVGILRLFGRFDLLSFSMIFSALTRLAGVSCAFLMELDFRGFVLTYLITGIIGQMFLLAATLYTIGIGRFFASLRQPFSGIFEIFPGIWDFVWTTNLHATLKLMSREADQLIIAATAGPAGLGLFKVAKQLSRILPMAADPLYQSIFPELSTLWAAGRKSDFRSLVRRTALLSFVTGITLWTVFVLWGKPFIEWSFGAEYTAAYPVAIVYMLALIVALVSLPLQPAMLAADGPKVSFKINLVSTILYLLLLWPLTRTYGINGAAGCYLVYYALWALLMKIRLNSVVTE